MTRFVTLALVCVGVMLSTAPPAAAHETRKVGPYEFVVGWREEPTYTGFKNAIGVDLSFAKTGKPVIDLEDTLDVEVTHGGETTTLTMEPDFLPGVFGVEGEYSANLIPTRPGEYTWHFVGTIGDVEIDETFTSGPDTFNSPEDAKAIQFPAQDPSTAELAERLERELPRAEEAATAAAADVSDDVDGARTIAFVALALGLLGLILGVVALARSSRARSATPAAAPSERDEAAVKAGR